MQLYDITQQFHSPYAEAIIVDVPWKLPRRVCKECYLPMHPERVGPYTVQWRPGSDVVPDLVFAGAGNLVVTDRVKVALERAGCTGYVAWPVAISEPKRPPGKRVPFVGSPYPGPPLWDLYITERVHAIPELSTLRFEGTCKRCGTPYYNVILPHQYWAIDRATWSASDFMIPAEINTSLMTPRVAEVLKTNGFTNINFWQRAELRDREGPPLYPIASDNREDQDKPPEAEPPSELAAMEVELPRLEKDDARSCPVPMRELLDYLRMESGDETIRTKDLTFIRTARIEDADYWIWRFEAQDGTEAYATVSRRTDGATCTGYLSNDDNLTPEQHIYGDYHEYF